MQPIAMACGCFRTSAMMGFQSGPARLAEVVGDLRPKDDRCEGSSDHPFWGSDFLGFLLGPRIAMSHTLARGALNFSPYIDM